MNYLPSLAMLLLMLVSQNQELPDAFHQLPVEVREKATIVVTGTYGQGRSPCIMTADGLRVWALESWFRVTKVYRGKVGGKSIYINSSRVPQNDYISPELKVGRKYLVLLQPSNESQKSLERGEHFPAWDAIGDGEIIAIVPLE